MKTVRVLAGAACFVLLVFGVVRTKIVGGKIEQIARPSRLFSLQFIESTLPQQDGWEAQISADHDRFFYVVSQQALRWVGKGSVAFAFATADDKYVVKFIDLSRFKSALNPGFFKRTFKHATPHSDPRMEDIFQSARLSFDELSEETGTVYVHLNRTKEKIHGLKLIDGYGQSQRTCGDDTCFIVQRRARPALKVLSELMDKGATVEAQQRIDQIFDLLTGLAQKGYIDGDDRVISNNNIGFTDDRAIYMDTFHFFPVRQLDLEQRMQYECRQRLLPLERWLNLSYPELAVYYANKRNDVLEAARCATVRSEGGLTAASTGV